MRDLTLRHKPLAQSAILTDAELETLLHTDILAGFNKRTLSVDTEVALAWGNLVAQSEQAGQRMPYVDSLIAATALFHGMTLVTRNTRDMEASGVALCNPWSD